MQKFCLLLHDVNVEELTYQNSLIEHTLILQDNDYVLDTSDIKSVATILANYDFDALNCVSFIENYKKYKSYLNKYHVLIELMHECLIDFCRTYALTFQND